jgi:hypothetical protein
MSLPPFHKWGNKGAQTPVQIFERSEGEGASASMTASLRLPDLPAVRCPRCERDQLSHTRSATVYEWSVNRFLEPRLQRGRARHG